MPESLGNVVIPGPMVYWIDVLHLWSLICGDIDSGITIHWIGKDHSWR